jgi:hypothetical protein
MSHEFKTVMAALDLLGYPSEPYDNWKGRGDREGEREQDASHGNVVCGPCYYGEHDEDQCWHRPGHYRCLCAVRGHKNG